MKLESLLEDDVITKETFDWLKPLHEQEEADLKEIRAAAEERKNDPFYNQHPVDSDEEDEDTMLLTTSTATLRDIEGTDAIVKIVVDTNSAGHGNKVWHASIATCRYLKEFLGEFKKRGDFFNSIELGAGTAVPSFFLAQLMMTKTIDHMNKGEAEELMSYSLYITDAKQYRNIKQILMSVGVQCQVIAHVPTLGVGSNIEFQVHPHNWGEIVNNEEADDGEGDYDSFVTLSYDLVIVSDCIYNPEHHDALLHSLASTLALPRSNKRCKRMGFEENDIGGRAVISFSLHGNVDDDRIWNFIENKIPSKRCPRYKSDGWKLNARCVSTSTSTSTSSSSSSSSSTTTTTQSSSSSSNTVREGWNMEETMTKLEMATEGMKPERWIAYVYEITWIRDDDDDDSDDGK